MRPLRPTADPRGEAFRSSLRFALLAFLAFAAPVFGVPAPGGPTSGASADESPWLEGFLRLKLIRPVAAEEALAEACRIAARVGSLSPGEAFLTFPPSPSGTEKAATKRRLGLDRWLTVRFPAGVALDPAAWRADPDVEIAERVGRIVPAAVPTDPLYPQQWEHANTGMNPGVPNGIPDSDLDTQEAWDLATGAGVRVTNMETVDWYHEDLIDNVWQNLGEDLDGDGRVIEWNSTLGRWDFDPDDDNLLDDDGNGYVDDYVGWNFVSGGNDPESGASGHGTATAGFLLASHDNGVGVAGTCPDCELLALRVAFESELVYAIDQGVRVVSMSFTGLNDAAWRSTVDYAEANDVVIVAAAGNSSLEISGYPEDPRVIGVTGTDPFDRLITLGTTGGWWGTNYGAHADVGAPAIYMTYLLAEAGYGMNGSGTSDAAPNVAGSVALMREVAPGLSAAEIRSILRSTTDPFLAPDRFGGTGRVNARAAVEAALVAEANGSFPVADLDASATSIRPNGTLYVYATADAAGFVGGTLRVGEGFSPSSWLLDVPLTAPRNGLIDSLDVRAFPVGTEFRIELEVTDVHGQTSRDAIHPTHLAFALFEPPPWPIATGETVTGVTLADVAPGAERELIVSNDTEIRVLDTGDTSLVSWPIPYDLEYIPPSPVSDVDGDGVAEVIAALGDGAGTATVHAYRADGSDAPGWPVTLPGAPRFEVTIVDVDGDGVDEIALLYGPVTSMSLALFDPDGQMRAGWPIPLGTRATSGPVVADVDGDGAFEIALRVLSGLQVWKGDATPPPGWPLTAVFTHPPVSGDFDGDGRDEFVLQHTQTLSMYDDDGTLMAGWPRVFPAPLNPLLAADLQGDGVTDLVVNSVDGRIWIVNGGAADLPGWPIVFPAIYRTRLLLDLDGDEPLEILVTDTDTFRNLSALELDGSTVDRFPFEIGAASFDHFVADDFDADGNVDLVFQTWTQGQTDAWQIHWLPIDAPRTDRGWFSVYRDSRNSRRGTGSAGAVTGVSGPTRSGVSLLPPRPNPFATRVTVPWTLDLSGDVRLRIHDVSGRVVRTLVSGAAGPGPHVTSWDGRDDAGKLVGSGVYWVALDVAGARSTRRVVRIAR
ncbi:MAG: S8 family serine peptidase [Gemmatimonadetes bacterium]|nr:S8 family serine peptidase [Gemmatimonadota bacterium]